MNTTVRKHPRSAAGIARHLSRILRENGFQKANTKDKYSWSEGYFVHRVGYSGTVHVDYYVKDSLREETAASTLKVAQMREVLFELGYISNHPRAIYIECRES